MGRIKNITDSPHIAESTSGLLNMQSTNTEARKKKSVAIKKSVPSSKIIDLDDPSFYFGKAKKWLFMNERGHRNQFKFNELETEPLDLQPPGKKVKTKKVKLADITFPITLLQHSVNDSLKIAQSNGINLNRLTLKDIKCIIKTSYEVLKQKVAKSIIEVKLAKTTVKSDKIVPFKQFITSLKEAATQTEGINLNKLVLADAELILRNTFRILRKI